MGGRSARDIAAFLGIKEKAVRRIIERHRQGTAETTPVTASVQPPRIRNIPIAVIVIVVIVIGCLAYAPYLPNSFVWDDTLLVTGNETIRDPANAAFVFRQPLSSKHFPDYYRPLQVLSYMLDYRLWQEQPFGYHLTALIIHLASSLLVLYLSLLVLRHRVASFFVAGLFAVHPASIAIVGYISGRGDLLGLFFSLAAVVLVVRYLLRRQAAWTLVPAIAAYCLAVFSKELYIITPLLILAFIVVYRKLITIDRYVKLAFLGMAAAVVLYVFMRATARDMTYVKMSDPSLWFDRIAVFPYILTNYIVALLVPINLGLEKRLFYSSVLEPRFVISYLTVVVVAAAFWYCRKRGDRPSLFFLCWFLISFIPLSHILYPLGHLWAPHWAYMASIGLYGALAAMTGTMLSGQESQRRMGKIAAGLGIAMLIFFTGMTASHARHWKDTKAIYTWAVERSPKSDRALYNLGTLYYRTGDYPKALELINKALDDPYGKRADTYYVRGSIYRNMGQFEKARADYEIAVQSAPDRALFHNDLGGVYLRLGLMDEAIAEIEKAIELDPGLDMAKRNLERAVEMRQPRSE